MVYGGAATGKRVMTSSSSPGISLMCEGLSYLAGRRAAVPGGQRVERGGPGLGTIQPSQADYFQAVQGRRPRRLPPDRAGALLRAGDVRFRAAGIRLGVQIPQSGDDSRRRRDRPDDGEGRAVAPPASAQDRRPDCRSRVRRVGRHGQARRRARATSLRPLELRLARSMERYQSETCRPSTMRSAANEVRLRSRSLCDDADYVLVALRLVGPYRARQVVEMARADGHRVGLLRPITLFPFPTEADRRAVPRGVKGFLSVEMSTGQMVEDVTAGRRRLARARSRHYGRHGRHRCIRPDEVLDALKSKLIQSSRRRWQKLK